MAKHVLVNAALVVNAVDLSDHVRRVTVNIEADKVDVTGMGNTAKQTAIGLSNDSFEVEFFQDYASGKVDATLWPLKGGSEFAVNVWPNGTVTAGTNPKYSSGTCILPDYQPLDGDIGAANMTTVTLLSQTAIARATA